MKTEVKKRNMTFNAILSGIKQVCSIIFPLITVPYVSRVLGKVNYGKIGFGNSMISYFTLFAGLGISTYAIREGSKRREDPQELQTFVNEVFTINIISTFISYIILFFMLMYWHRVKNYRLLIFIQSITIAFTTLGVTWANNIFEDFAYTTYRYILVQIVSIVLMLLFVKKADDYLLYAGIVTFANSGGNLLNTFYIRRHYIKVQLTLKTNFKKHIKPLLYLFSNTLATTIYVSSDITLLTLLQNDAQTGIYTIASYIYNIVKQLINAVIGVALPRFSLYYSKGENKAYNDLLTNVFHAVLILILPATVGLFMLSSNIIVIIGGQSYASGANALKILSIALGISVLCFLFVYGVMIVQGMEKYCLISTLISAAVNVGLNFIFIPMWGMNGAAFTTVISELLVLLASLYYSRGKYKLSLNFRDIMPCLISCVGIVIVCSLTSKMIQNDILIIIIAVLLSVLLYACIMLGFKDSIAVGYFDRAMKKIKRGK